MDENTTALVRRALWKQCSDVNNDQRETMLQAVAKGFRLAESKNPERVAKVQHLDIIDKDFRPIEEFFDRQHSAEIEIEFDQPKKVEHGLLPAIPSWAHWRFLRLLWLSFISFEKSADAKEPARPRPEAA